MVQSVTRKGESSPLSSFRILTSGLAKHQDIELHVVICDASVSSDTIVKDNRIVFHLLTAIPEQLCALTFHQINAKRIHRLLRKIEPDIVHGDHSGVYAYSAVTSRYPHVITLRGVFAEIMKVVPRKRLLTRWHFLSFMENLTIAKARNIISISPYITSLIANRFRGRIFPVENPVDDSYLSPVTGGRESRRRILFVGTLYPLKGVRDLLTAFWRVSSSSPELRLTVTGPAHPGYTQYAQELRLFVQEHGLENTVEFTGFSANQTVRALMDDSLCVVLPSYQETSPMVIAEAMARGVPVISTTVGGIPYLIRDGTDGILVTPGDVDGIANALARISVDADLWHKYSSNSRAQAERRFSSAMVVEQTVDVYKSILHLG